MTGTGPGENRHGADPNPVRDYMGATDRRLQWALLILFLAFFAFLAIAPKDRQDWAMENGLVFALMAIMACSWKRLRMSNGSALLLFAFLCIHEVGAHYTYSLVPYEQWSKSLLGHDINDVLGWRRNQFDRFAHFAYGLLLVYPVRELLVRLTPLRGFAATFLAMNLILSTSAGYEMIEWLGGEYVGGDKSARFIAAQNDKWDSQKDMALALIGAVLAMGIACLYRLFTRSGELKPQEISS